ncbi:MAG: AN1-type zinc finger domain-containing protein [Nitrososphaeria archaeon]
MKCEYCGQDEPLPFKCPYCGKFFCVEHRLPEAHSCEKIFLATSPSKRKEVYRPKFETSEARFSYKKLNISFSPREKLELLFATIIVSLVGMSFLGWSFNTFELIFALIAFALSFFVHEIAHKISAIRAGLIAFFKLDTVGIILTFISTFSPLKIIAPGSVVILGYLDLRAMGKISLSGPLTNIVIGSILYPLRFFSVPFSNAINAICLLNLWIALFNLIPLGILDGKKIFVWDKRVWLVTFLFTLFLLLSTYIY